MIHVTIWNEYIHEQELPEIQEVYPNGIHKCIEDFLEKDEEITVKTVTLDMPENGLTESVLEQTDVLIWWGHCAHDKVSDTAISRVQQRVLEGMGLILLHSAHYSKIAKKLLGTSCSLTLREDDRERLWCINPSHPIAKGVPNHIDLEIEEMYGEPFDIPTPDELIFLGWFAGGEVFRSGCIFNRGRGKIFYFQPGHEAYHTFYNKDIQTIIRNAVHYTAPAFDSHEPIDCIHAEVSPEKALK